MKEIFKIIANYPSYEISNLGNVKSLNYRQTNKSKILKPGKNGRGYLTVNLTKNKNKKNFTIHKLMAINFLNHKPCKYKVIIDHKDHNPLNNELSNLQLISNRENCSKDKRNKSSKYTGVSWSNKYQKWVSQFWFNGKSMYLGSYKKEYDAHLAYQKILTDLTTI